MGENVSLKAIMIGVGVFIALITITAVIVYYNMAVNSVRSIGSGANISENYKQDIEDSLLKAGQNINLSGKEVKNLINYFYKKENTNIIFENLPVLDNKNSRYDKLIYKQTRIELKDELNYTIANRNILPAQQFHLEKNIKDMNMSLVFTLN